MICLISFFHYRQELRFNPTQSEFIYKQHKYIDK